MIVRICYLLLLVMVVITLWLLGGVMETGCQMVWKDNGGAFFVPMAEAREPCYLEYVTNGRGDCQRPLPYNPNYCPFY